MFEQIVLMMVLCLPPLQEAATISVTISRFRVCAAIELLDFLGGFALGLARKERWRTGTGFRCRCRLSVVGSVIKNHFSSRSA